MLVEGVGDHLAQRVRRRPVLQHLLDVEIERLTITAPPHPRGYERVPPPAQLAADLPQRKTQAGDLPDDLRPAEQSPTSWSMAADAGIERRSQ